VLAQNEKLFLNLVLLDPLGPVELFKISQRTVSAQISGKTKEATVVEFDHAKEFELVSGAPRREIPAGSFSKVLEWSMVRIPGDVQRLPNVEFARREPVFSIKATSGARLREVMVFDATRW
jgi:hypothetical protein